VLFRCRCCFLRSGDFRKKKKQDKESCSAYFFAVSLLCCLLFVVCCLLFVVCCLLFVVCCLLSYLLPLTVFSFRTTTTMNNLNNTSNNNNQQAIHNQPKIPYVKHLVEEDKHQQVSIFRVYHFQNRIAFTTLVYF
jgi:hypothetical protein